MRSYSYLAEQADRKTMEAWQLEKLRMLLERVYARGGFYRDWLDKARVKPEKIKSLKDFSKAVPLMRKDDTLANQLASPPFGTRLSAPQRDVMAQHISGGTSGRGKETHGATYRDRLAMAQVFAYGYHYSGLEPGDAVAFTLPMSTSGAGVVCYDSFSFLRTRVLPLATYDTVTKLKLMREHGARAVVATPSYLTHMEIVAKQQLGWDLAKDLNIDIILTAAESFSIERALAIESAWGGKLYEWYGASQRVGACNCHLGAVHDGKRGVLHHLPHLEYVETINPDTLEPVEYGEEGEIVTTFLGSEASPLIRYATNDKARLLHASSCSCGLCFDGYESGTISRYDDMIKVRAVNLWPATVDDVVLTVPGVIEYQGVVLTSLSGGEDIQVRVEFEATVSDATKARALAKMAADLQAQVGLRMTFSEAEAPLPQFKDHESKARRWRDERKH